MTSPIHGSGGKPHAAFIDWCLAWWLASTNRWLTMTVDPVIRPYLSSAVASEDKEKPFSGFSLASIARQ
jgi:hypothetical protein